MPTLSAPGPTFPGINALEANFDGLVGPTHNYAGLSEGNLASGLHAGRVSRPRIAALQGLTKMEAVAALGLPQGFLPPHERPALWKLREAGLVGSDETVLATAAREQPLLLARSCSASAMWTANAATVAPAIDTLDARTHLVVANLRSMPHRRIEANQTLRALRAVFHDADRFAVHAALPTEGAFGDEGAANHTRLVAHDGTGVHLFVFGAHADGSGVHPTRQPARQTLEASMRVAGDLHLPPQRCVFAQQSPTVIDAGVFHNDVIAVGSGSVLLFHAEAFLDRTGTLQALRSAVGERFCPVEVHADELTVTEAVSTYLFNSQLIVLPDGPMMLVCPSEVRDHARASAVVDRIVGDATNPIAGVMYLDVRESMRNGGGPACLRLRVPLDAAALASVHPGFLLTPERAAWLRTWIERHYPDQLSADDLGDPSLLRRSRDALDALTDWIGAGPLYPFQGASPA